MKTKEKKELFTKTVDELKKLLDEAKKTLVSIKLDHQQNKLKDTRSIFNTRKNIATLHSIINMKKTIEVVKEPARNASQSDAGGEVKTVVKKARGGKSV